MEEFTKPFITNITIAKKKIKDLLKEFDFDISNKHTINSKDMIINFKAILKENEIKYNDILNYTLAIIDKKIDFIKKDINKNKYIILENIMDDPSKINTELILVKMKKNLNNIKKNKTKDMQKDIENIMQTIDARIKNLKMKKDLEYDTLEKDFIESINNCEKTIEDLKGSVHKYKEITEYINSSLDELSILKDFYETYIDIKDSFKESINESDEFFSFNEDDEFDNIKSSIKNDCLKIKNKLFTHLKEMLKFVFFIYSESDKTSATVKLSLILAKSVNFMNHNYSDKYLKNKLYKLIFDEIHHLLKRNKNRKYSHNQNLYLLINLKEIKNYKKLDFNILEAIFLSEEMNYFDIVVLLYYIENDPEFKKIKEKIKEKILSKYKDFNNKNTELILLSMDIFACPFLDKNFKIEILEYCKIDKKNIQNYIIKFSMKQKFWFTKWKNVDILKELEEKKSYEVY
ncbi:hypothetical protein GQ251_08390 [Campylobacter coli]|nr:hypothetical protein [Campylobacter coli]